MFRGSYSQRLDIARLAVKLSTASSVRLPLADSLIAAAAGVANATLVHCDAHFAAIPSRRLRQLTVT